MKSFKTHIKEENNFYFDWSIEVNESLKQYSRKSDHAVIAFSDFSRPHENHSNLINSVQQHAKQVDGDPHIFVSNPTGSDKGILSSKENMILLRSSFPDVKRTFHSTSSECPSIYHALSDLHKKGYRHATAILDDSDNSKASLHQFNGLFDSSGNGYNFKSLNILKSHEVNPSSGDRPLTSTENN